MDVQDAVDVAAVVLLDALVAVDVLDAEVVVLVDVLLFVQIVVAAAVQLVVRVNAKMYALVVPVVAREVVWDTA